MVTGRTRRSSQSALSPASSVLVPAVQCGRWSATDVEERDGRILNVEVPLTEEATRDNPTTIAMPRQQLVL